MARSLTIVVVGVDADFAGYPAADWHVPSASVTSARQAAYTQETHKRADIISTVVEQDKQETCLNFISQVR